jgi:hypothetical protein
MAATREGAAARERALWRGRGYGNEGERMEENSPEQAITG